MVGILLVLGLRAFPASRLWLSLILGLMSAGIFAVGVWVAGQAEKFFGRTDPSQVVIDEVVGQLVTFLARPDASWKWLLAGFLLFRALDVAKPFPARGAERLPGGWGVMWDDVVAGAYSLAALFFLGLGLK